LCGQTNAKCHYSRVWQARKGSEFPRTKVRIFPQKGLGNNKLAPLRQKGERHVRCTFWTVKSNQRQAAGRDGRSNAWAVKTEDEGFL